MGRKIFEQKDFPEFKPEKTGQGYTTNKGLLIWHEEYGGAWYLDNFKENQKTIEWFMEPIMDITKLTQ